MWTCENEFPRNQPRNSWLIGIYRIKIDFKTVWMINEIIGY